MIPTEVLKNKVIKTAIKSITSSDVLIRERYDGVPIQPVTNNVLVLASYEVSTFDLIGAVNIASVKATNWKTCTVVAKGEYVNSISLNDNVYGSDINTTAVYSKTNDYSATSIKNQLKGLKPSERTIHTQTNPKTLVYEYFIMDAGQISAIILEEDIEEETNQLDLELEYNRASLPITLK